jgi:hypothetical protein
MECPLGFIKSAGHFIAKSKEPAIHPQRILLQTIQFHMAIEIPEIPALFAGYRNDMYRQVIEHKLHTKFNQSSTLQHVKNR